LDCEVRAVRINVNGEVRDVPPGTTVAALLELLAVPRQATAVEVNRLLVPRSEHAARALAEGDAVEIVTLVGGG
jgi:sulfur carrier protein